MGGSLLKEDGKYGYHERRTLPDKEKVRTKMRIKSFLFNDHMAAIIPVAGSSDSFQFPWPDCMMPVGAKMTAIQRAVQEAAIVGVDSIWIVVKGEIGPLLREGVGESIVDPMSLTRLADFKRFRYRMGSEANLVGSLKMIPIYYIPLHWTERSESSKDFTLWSVVYGAYVARNISRKITSWARITRFYVVSPHSVYSLSSLLDKGEEKTWIKFRKKIRNKKKLFYLKHEDKSFLTGDLMGFIFEADQYAKMHKTIHRYNQRELESVGVQLKEISKAVEGDYKGSETWEVNSFHDIDSWDGYLDYMAFLKDNKDRSSHIHQNHGFSGLRVGRQNWGRDTQDLDGVLINEFFEGREV